jgi:hypothetical protein
MTIGLLVYILTGLIISDSLDNSGKSRVLGEAKLSIDRETLLGPSPLAPQATTLVQALNSLLDEL